MPTQTRLPTGDSATDNGWTAHGGGSKWSEVDDPIGSNDGDTTYITKTGANASQSFTFSAFTIPTTDEIVKLTLTMFYKRVNTSLNINTRVRVNGTVTDSGAGGVPGTASYSSRAEDYTTNPDTGAAWTPADINGSGSHPLQEIGVRNTQTAGTEEARVTQLWAAVQHNPQRSASLDATATIATAGLVIRPRVASITATATIASAGLVERPRSAGLSASASISVSGLVIRPRASSITATAAIDCNGLVERPRSASLDATATIDTAGLAERLRSASLAAVASISVSGEVEAHQPQIFERAASLSATVSVTVAGLTEHLRSAYLSAVATITAASQRINMRPTPEDVITPRADKSTLQTAAAAGSLTVSTGAETVQIASDSPAIRLR